MMNPTFVQQSAATPSSISDVDFVAIQERFKETVFSQRQQLEKLKQSRNDYGQLEKKLVDLPKKLNFSCMVPIGDLAFMPGHIVHTNEILCLLGENYFVKRTATQAVEIVKRRIRVVDENIKSQQQILNQTFARMGLTSDLANLESEYRNDVVDIKEDYDPAKEKQFEEERRKKKKTAISFADAITQEQEDSIQKMFSDLQLEENEQENEQEENKSKNEQKKVTFVLPGEKTEDHTSSMTNTSKHTSTTGNDDDDDDLEEEFTKFFQRNPNAINDETLTGSLHLKKELVKSPSILSSASTPLSPSPSLHKENIPHDAQKKTSSTSGFTGKVIERSSSSSPSSAILPPKSTEEEKPKKISRFKQMRAAK